MYERRMKYDTVANSTHPLYKRWQNLQQHYFNPYSAQYHLYGGRPLEFEFRWRNLDHFIEDIGPRPGPCCYLTRADKGVGHVRSNLFWLNECSNERYPIACNVESDNGLVELPAELPEKPSLLVRVWRALRIKF